MFAETDFMMTDNYVLRLKPLAIKRLIEELRLSLNSRVQYKSRSYAWNMILKLKTQELARYLVDRTCELDLVGPRLDFNSEDSRELRQKVLSLSLFEARKLGMGKSSFWNLQNRCGSNIPLKVYLRRWKLMTGNSRRGTVSSACSPIS